MRVVLLAALVLWLGGCATVGQKNHGQPVVLPVALKTQLEGKTIAIGEIMKSSCYAPATEAVTMAEAWQPAKLTPRGQLGSEGYYIEYTFWGCEDLQEGASRHIGNYVLTSFSFLIIPTIFETYANLQVRVYKADKMVFEGKYRELTKNQVFGWVAIPIKIGQLFGRTPVKESAAMTTYRNLTRQFTEDIASEYLFD